MLFRFGSNTLRQAGATAHAPIIILQATMGLTNLPLNRILEPNQSTSQSTDHHSGAIKVPSICSTTHFVYAQQLEHKFHSNQFNPCSITI